MIGDSPGRKLVKSEQLLGSLSKAQSRLSFALASFHNLGCGKSPIPVWLGAPNARVQFASFLDRCATSRTRHGEYLFQREFLGFHHHIMRRSTAGKMLNIAHFKHSKRQVSLGFAGAVFDKL
jgi:hypothetical protein